MKRLFITILTLAVLVPNLPAQILGATDNSHTNNSSIYKPTGHYLRFEAGYPSLFTLGYGYQVNPYIMFGAGGGIGFQPAYGYRTNGLIYSTKYLLGFPAYAELVLSTPRHRHALTADFKVGGSFLLSPYLIEDPQYFYKAVNPFFFKTSLGYRFVNFGIDLGASYCGLWSFAFNLSYNLPLKVNR